MDKSSGKNLPGCNIPNSKKNHVYATVESVLLLRHTFQSRGATKRYAWQKPTKCCPQK